MKYPGLPLRFKIENLLFRFCVTRIVLRKIQRTRVHFHAAIEKLLRKRDPSLLIHSERKIFSQNGEDGIIQEVFRRIGNKNRYFVEFGIQSGLECCTRNLLENHGWSGLWIEGDPKNFSKARGSFQNRPVKILNRFITKENIESIFSEAQVPNELDLLVIDVDGNDFWIWQEIAKHYSPRVLVIEYNAALGPFLNWIMPYNATHISDGTLYFGASLNALQKLGKNLGYTLVSTESQGVNAFFIRNSELAHFQSPRPSSFWPIYSAPKYGSEWFGHTPAKRPETFSGFWDKVFWNSI